MGPSVIRSPYGPVSDVTYHCCNLSLAYFFPAVVLFHRERERNHSEQSLSRDSKTKILIFENTMSHSMCTIPNTKCSISCINYTIPNSIDTKNIIPKKKYAQLKHHVHQPKQQICQPNQKNTANKTPKEYANQNMRGN